MLFAFGERFALGELSGFEEYRNIAHLSSETLVPQSKSHQLSRKGQLNSYKLRNERQAVPARVKKPDRTRPTRGVLEVQKTEGLNY